jgi:hypothetical protein
VVPNVLAILWDEFAPGLANVMNQLPFQTGDPWSTIGAASDLYVAHQYQWTRPIYFALTNEVVTYAAVWEERSVIRVLPTVSSPNLGELISDLVVLKELRASRASTLEFVERARAIWDRGQSRDFAQTAIARLFELVGLELHPQGNRRVSLYCSSINVLASGANYPLSILEGAVEEFRTIWDERCKGVSPAKLLGLIGADNYSRQFSGSRFAPG